MNRLLLLLSGLGLVAAFPPTQQQAAGGHHKGAAGHDQNCVDISRYSELQYNTSRPTICTYRVTQQCKNEVTQRVCANVPVTTCTLQPQPECTKTPLSKQVLRNDKVEQRQYTSKVCRPAGQQTITQTKTRPVCKQVAKPQHCESKWVINDLGEKVWDGNENCAEELVEECSLETYTQPIVVPVVSCQDGEVLTYQEPVVASEEVTAFSSHCKPAASPVCSTTSRQECIEVTAGDCVDTIVPECGASQETFQVPYQTFDHRLKCLA